MNPLTAKSSYSIFISIAAASLLTLASATISTAATLVLTGNVPANCVVTVTPEAAASSLDLTTDQTNLKVATVNEKCNDPDGYTVDLQTAYGNTNSVAEARVESATTSENLIYTVTYDAAAVTFDATVIDRVTDSNAKTGGTGIDRDIDISYLGVVANLAAGFDYTDTLTVTIAAK